MKWMYKGSIGVLATEEEADILKDYFTDEKCENLKEFKHIAFSMALSMIGKAKESVKQEEPSKEIKEEVKKEEPEEIKVEKIDSVENEQPKKRGRPKKED